MFFNRENIIETFQDKISIFSQNKRKNIYNVALLGLRRTGKTCLIKNILNNYCKEFFSVYLDFSNINTTPSNFSKNFVLKLFSGIYKKQYFELDDLRIDIDDNQILNYFKNYQQILSKNDNFQVINKTFGFVTLLSQKYKLVIALDEFQDLFDLRNFKDLKNIDDIFRSHLLDQDNVFYIISGSYPEIIKDMVLNPKNKLYSHFEIFEIGNFDKKTTYQFAKHLNDKLNNFELKNIYSATAGNPYLIAILSPKLNNEKSFDNIIKNELFNTKGQIYNHYIYILENSLSKIGKTPTLNGILKQIALDNSSKISELSKILGVSEQLILKELKKLKKISILYQDKEKNIKFVDYLFRFFCYYYFSGYELYELDNHKYYLQRMEELENNLQKSLSELGRAKEFELYYEIKENQGKIWKGIKLPKFKLIQKNYFTTIGDEVDLFCQTSKGKIRAFELKYKNKQVGKKEIDKFMNKIQADKYVLVSKTGFSDKVDKNYKKMYLIDLGNQK